MNSNELEEEIKMNPEQLEEEFQIRGQRKISYEIFQKQNFQPMVVGVGGGSASGKTTLSNVVMKAISDDKKCLIISLDSFYKEQFLQNIDQCFATSLTPDQDPKEFNFDHPDALDFDLAYQCIKQLISWKPTKIPLYSFKTNSREGSVAIQPADIILIEGILALYDQRLIDLMSFTIFVHCDDDIRLSRRIIRDVKERGRQVPGILTQYHRFVKRAFDDYVRPTMNSADIIVPGSRPNRVSIQFVVYNLKSQLKSMEKLKSHLNTKSIFFGGEIEDLFNFQLDRSNLFNPNSYVTSQISFIKGGDKKLGTQKLLKLLDNSADNEIWGLLVLKIQLILRMIYRYQCDSLVTMLKQYLKSENIQDNYEDQVCFYPIDSIKKQKYIVLPFMYNNYNEVKQDLALLCLFSNQINFIKTSYPTENFIFILLNMISTIESLMSLCEKYDNILIFAVYCISSLGKFKETLQQNIFEEIFESKQKQIKTASKIKKKIICNEEK